MEHSVTGQAGDAVVKPGFRSLLHRTWVRAQTAAVSTASELSARTRGGHFPGLTRPGRLSGVRWGGMLRRTLLGGAAFGVLYYGLLGALAHRVDDDPDFRPATPTQGGSAAVDMAAALIEREVTTNGWTANDTWMAPNALLDNTPNFQLGIMRAVGRFSFEMLDQIARTRGSSSTDPDLERAMGFLQYPGDIWFFDFDRSWLPTTPSEDQYRAGHRALAAYNARLVQGKAVFERRADVLAATLSRIAADIGSLTAQVDRKVSADAGLLSATADDVFYQNKGAIYAYYMLLDALGRDFEPMIGDGSVAAVWSQMMASMRHAASLRPPVVINGAGDESIFANHLILQGFYMKRSILQIEEIVSVLRV